MREWLMAQLEHFNIFIVLFFVIYDIVTGNARLQKQLKEQSEEFYKEIEEVKDEIRGITRNQK
jgi:hypothetical protein